MKQALGLVEIAGLSTAIVAADAMAKAANIEIVEVENTKGLGYMTIKAVGDVGAVKAAVDVGRQVGTMHGKLVSYKVIPRPSDYVEQYFVDPDGGEKKQPEAAPAEVEPENVPAVKTVEAEETAEAEAETAEEKPEENAEAESEPAEKKPEENAEVEAETAEINPEENAEVEPEAEITETDTADAQSTGTEAEKTDSKPAKKAPSKSVRKKGSAAKKESGQNEIG